MKTLKNNEGRLKATFPLPDPHGLLEDADRLGYAISASPFTLALGFTSLGETEFYLAPVNICSI
jgi:hypothetical protein